MHVNELPQIFRDCLGSADGRYDLSRPWAANGYVYATDARIIVRMPVPPSGVDGELSANPPRVESLGWRDEYREPIEIPQLPEPIIVVDDCDFCDGQGCDDCGNTGKEPPREKYHTTTIGKIKLNNCYLRIIKNHGGKLRMRKDRRREMVPVAFVGDGWDGLLMNCDSRSEDEA